MTSGGALKLSLSDIRADGGTQPRAGLDLETVDDYAESMAAGIAFPPVTVFYDGSDYWLADGFHRFAAAAQAQLGDINCDIHQGKLEEAQWYSFSANKNNGLRRTNDDKQRAVKAALGHPRSQGLSDRQIAAHVGVAHITVSRWRQELSGTLCQIESPTRTVTRNGSTYEMDTANIGRQAEVTPSPVAEVSHESDPPVSSQMREYFNREVACAYIYADVMRSVEKRWCDGEDYEPVAFILESIVRELRDKGSK